MSKSDEDSKRMKLEKSILMPSQHKGSDTEKLNPNA